MFIDGVHHSDEKFAHDAREISKSFLAIIGHYQSRRPTPELLGQMSHGPEVSVQAGSVTTHCVLAAAAFALAVLVKELPGRERRKLREYMVSKFDEVLREHGS